MRRPDPTQEAEAFAAHRRAQRIRTWTYVERKVRETARAPLGSLLWLSETDEFETPEVPPRAERERRCRAWGATNMSDIDATIAARLRAQDEQEWAETRTMQARLRRDCSGVMDEIQRGVDASRPEAEAVLADARREIPVKDRDGNSRTVRLNDPLVLRRLGVREDLSWEFRETIAALASHLATPAREFSKYRARIEGLTPKGADVVNREDVLRSEVLAYRNLPTAIARDTRRLREMLEAIEARAGGPVVFEATRVVGEPAPSRQMQTHAARAVEGEE